MKPSRMQHSNIDHFIFDLIGVLFTFDQRSILALLGTRDTIAYLLTHWKNPIKKCFEVIKIISEREPDSPYPQLFYKGNPQPSFISACMIGDMTAKQAIDQLQDHLHKLEQEGFFSCQRETRLMHRMLSIMIDPKTKLKAFKPNRPLIKLITTLKEKQGNICYIISNLDSDTYALLETTYPEVFTLFSQIVISCEVKLLKPYPSIYEHLLENRGLAPQSCLFVDDQPENIEAAQDIGITGILYTNMRSLKKQLSLLKIIE